MSTKDPMKKQKRPAMAIYIPRGRRPQDEVRRSPDDDSQSQSCKAAPKKNHSQKSRVFERSRDYSEQRPPRETVQPAATERQSSQQRPPRETAEKSRQHADEPRHFRSRGPPAERDRLLSEESEQAAMTSHSKGTLTVSSAAIANGHGPPKTAGRPPEESKITSAPPDEREPRRLHVSSSPGLDERAIDLTVKPVDLSLKPTEGDYEAADGGEARRRGASSPATQRHRDTSPESRRRPRGPTGVYVPRAARRHCDSTGEPPSPGDGPQSSVAAAPTSQDGGDTTEGHGRPGKAESSAGPDVPPPRAAGGHRRRDSETSTGRGDGEKTGPASPQVEAREEKGEAVRKEPPAADPPSARDDGWRKSSASGDDSGAERPPLPGSRPRAAVRAAGRAERQRAASPPEIDLLVLEEAFRPAPVPAGRRAARTNPTGSTPPSGLLYVPGGSHNDPPEPAPLHTHPHSNSQPHSHPYSQAAPRHLFDPNNPGQVLEVTSRAADCRERRQDSSRPYVDPYSTVPAAAGFSDPCAQASHSTNANRIAQLLGRAVGEFEYMIASNRLTRSWDIVCRIREHLQTECKRLMVSDLRTWMTLGVDQTIWRSLYYAVIEELRSMALPADQQFMLRNTIDLGIDFFAELVMTLPKAYDIDVLQLGNVYFDPEEIRRKRYFSSVAALSQRLNLCLGDLTRYQFQLGRLPNMVQAHTFYLRAQQMNPKNGRPFNQLAIVALYGHRRLDCVYLYARALMAANPFHTARESLLSLFHESSRRYAARSPMPGQMAVPATELRTERGADLRTETWVHPGRGERLQRTLRPEPDAPPEQAELRRAADADLLKAFTTTYLHVQGKLYTRVSLETYQEDACVMLRQFSELLSREPMPLKSADMLHILAINMFNIANTKLKDERLGSELRSTYQELALAVAIEMAGHVIHRACQLLAQCPLDGGRATDRLLEPFALETCMVFVKVWCDWLLSSSDIWNPPPCTADYRVAGVADCWASLAELTNLLRLRENEETGCFPSNQLNTVSSGEKTESVVRLPEDLCLESFSPLLCGEHHTRFVDPEVCSVERGRDLLRMRGVLFVTEQFLCGTEPAALRLLKTADGACRYVSQVSSHAPAEEAAEPGRRPDSPDVQVEWSRQEERRTSELPPLPTADSDRPELARLQQQKQALERRARRQEEHSRRVEAIAASAHASVTLEVRPRYLVADTNCYVDYLEQLESLVRQHSAFTLTVPVTVLAELDGLSRPGGGGRPRPGQSDEHVRQVRRTARAALDFVRERGVPHVRCATSRGHLLSSAVFTAEDDGDEEATNDDRILSCCRNLERGVSDQQPDGSQHLTREVVLLTDDRNLRLKAFSMDVPTRTVPDFLAWAS